MTEVRRTILNLVIFYIGKYLQPVTATVVAESMANVVTEPTVNFVTESSAGGSMRHKLVEQLNQVLQKETSGRLTNVTGLWNMLL